MQESGKWDSQMPLQNIDEDIDIEYTDLESESEYSVNTSDNDFIDPRDDLHEIRDYDPSYTDELSSSVSSDNDFSGKLWEIGEYDEITVLDKQDIEGTNGRATQVLIQCWVEEGIVEDLLDLLRVYRQETLE